MKPTMPLPVKCVVIGFFILSGFLTAQPVKAANTIGGFIFDRSGSPLADIDVELLDDFYRTINRMKTDSSGRYQFSGLPDDNYTIRVFAFRYDLEDQSQRVELKSINALPGQSGSMFYPLDFYLQPRKGGLRDSETGVIFAQDVPKEAEKLYKQALEDFSKKRNDEGFTSLQKSLEIFPKYYVALLRYGQELVAKKQYSAATMIFMEAAEVNPKAPLPYYYAGNALMKLGDKYNKNALLALTEAETRAPNAASVLLSLGSVERRMGKFGDAERHLLKAKKISQVKVPEIQYELWQLYAKNLKKYKEAADELEGYLKATKLSDADEAKAKQEIADLRAKAKAQPAN